jgi:hypothetical protein
MKKHIAALTVLFFSLVPIFGLYAQTPDTAWSRLYGGDFIDLATYVKQTNDGGYFLAGYSRLVSSIFNILAIRTDSLGDTIWTRLYGGDDYDIQPTNGIDVGDGYIIVGRSHIADSSYNKNGYILKINYGGDTLWSRSYGGEEDDYFNCITEAYDGGYILVGYHRTYGAWSLKIDVNGNLVWEEYYPLSQYSFTYLYSIAQTYDNCYVMCGFASHGGPYNDILMIKVDSFGEEMWIQTLSPDSNNVLYDVILDSADGGYLGCGGAGSSNDDYENFYLVKFAPNGDTLWSARYGNNIDDYQGLNIEYADNHGYIVCGYYHSESNHTSHVFIIKVDSIGNELWSRSFGRDNGLGVGIDRTLDGGCVIAGRTNRPNNGATDFYLIKLNGEQTAIDQEILTTPDRLALVGIYPNPFNNSTNIYYSIPQQEQIDLSIYDILGRKVETLVDGIQVAGNYQITWNASGLSSGVYFIRLSDDYHTTANKTILLK